MIIFSILPGEQNQAETAQALRPSSWVVETGRQLLPPPSLLEEQLRDAPHTCLLTEQSFRDSGELGPKSLDLRELVRFPCLFQEAW